MIRPIPTARNTLASFASVTVICLTVCLGLASRADAQKVLLYNELTPDGILKYRGFGGMNVTTAVDWQWRAMTRSQFEQYDLIWLGPGLGSAAPYDALYDTRGEWAPAISGRLLVTGLDPTHHHVPGTDIFVNDAVDWLLSGQGTALYVESDIGATGLDFLDHWNVSGCLGFNCFDEDQMAITQPPHPVMANSTPLSLGNWGFSSHTSIAVVPPGWDIVNTGPGLIPVTIVFDNASCSFQSPMAGSTVKGDVVLSFDARDPQNDPMSASFLFSTNGGITFDRCATAQGSPHSNPSVPIATPAASEQFFWDSVADGIGILNPEAATIRISVWDGLSISSCDLDVTVDNYLAPPSCTATGPLTVGSDEIPIYLMLSSGTALTVDVGIEFSEDAGVSWRPASSAGSSQFANPSSGVPVGPAIFVWNSRRDGIGSLTPAVGILIRAELDDGASPFLGSCQTAPFEVDNTSQCTAICGDCNEDGAGPSVVDALSAAQLAAALAIPTPGQQVCCDVDQSGSLGIVDALLIAQFSAALPALLSCP